MLFPLLRKFISLPIEIFKLITDSFMILKKLKSIVSFVFPWKELLNLLLTFKSLILELL